MPLKAMILVVFGTPTHNMNLKILFKVKDWKEKDVIHLKELGHSFL